MSGVEEGSVLRLSVNETTDPIEYTVLEADIGDDVDETRLNVLNNFVALINQSSAMDRPDSQGGRIVAAADTEAIALVLTSTTTVRTQMEIQTIEIRGLEASRPSQSKRSPRAQRLGPLQRGEEPSEV